MYKTPSLTSRSMGSRSPSLGTPRSGRQDPGVIQAHVQHTYTGSLDSRSPAFVSFGYTSLAWLLSSRSETSSAVISHGNVRYDGIGSKTRCRLDPEDGRRTRTAPGSGNVGKSQDSSVQKQGGNLPIEGRPTIAKRSERRRVKHVFSVDEASRGLPPARRSSTYCRAEGRGPDGNGHPTPADSLCGCGRRHGSVVGAGD